MLRQWNRVPDAIRDQIIQNYERGKTATEVAEFLALPVSTVRSVLRQFRMTGTISSVGWGGSRRTILTEEIKRAILEYVDDTPTISLRAISERILR